MFRVLFVDDDQTTMVLIARKLKPYSDQFEIVTATNGKEALSYLAHDQIDMVVTDLSMPEMDGFELLTHMNNEYPNIPAVVITAFNNQKVETHLAQAHQVKVIEKPIDYEALVAAIQRTLETLVDKCTVKGISLPNFLQLIQWEEKSCLLEIGTRRGKRGFFYAREGELHDAIFGSQTAADAAYAMLALDDPKITIHPLPARETKRRIHQDLMSILMEGMRRKDEEPLPTMAADDNAGDDMPSVDIPHASHPVSSIVPSSDRQGVTVLVVEDSKVMRRAITDCLSRCEKIGAVEEADNGRDAIALNESLRPDVITMDICMPIMDGLTALKHIMIRQPTPVVMVSTLTRDGAWETFEALRLGAVDFIDKPNRMAGTAIDRQLVRLESKILSAHRTNRQELKLLRPPSGRPPADFRYPQRGRSKVLVAAAAEGGYRAMLAVLSEMELHPAEGFIAVLRSDSAYLDAFAVYLEDFSAVPVKRPQAGETLQTGVCYLTSTQEPLVLAGRGDAVIFTRTDEKDNPDDKAADRMMASVADIFGETTLGLILCGDNGDGVEGLRSIKSAGGHTIAPKPECCLFPETVRLAVQHGVVDRVFSPGQGDWRSALWGD